MREEPQNSSPSNVLDYAALFRHALDGILFADDDARYVDANPAICKALGYTREELLKLSVWDITEVSASADTRELWDRFTREGMQSGEIQLRRKDGTFICVEYRAVAHIRPGVHLSIMRDISRRKQIETELIRSRDYYLSIFDTFSAPVWRCGVDAKCDFFNASWLKFTGRNMEQELGDGWAENVHPDDLEFCLRTFLENFHARLPFKMEYRLRRHDGEYRWILDEGSPYSNPEGEFAGFIGSCYDITERKSAENMLRQSMERQQLLARHLLSIQEQERSHLARELHDEIGQALTAAKINLQMLETKLNSSEIPRLQDSISILERMLEGVRQISINLRPPALDDLGLVAALRAHLKRQAERAGLQFAFNASAEDARFAADVETACFRIAQAAVSNVLRHAAARKITVDLNQEPDGIHLWVRDDGIGFDVTLLRSPAETLGVVSMHERAALLGGRVSIQSSPGAGTEVYAFIPDGTPYVRLP